MEGAPRDGRGRGALLEDAGLLLKPPDVCDDLGEIVPGDIWDLRHVAELPVMGAHPHLRCAIEGAIRVMVGFVDLVEERRTDGGPLGADAVARRATAVEEGLAFAEGGGRLDGWHFGDPVPGQCDLVCRHVVLLEKPRQSTRTVR